MADDILVTIEPPLPDVAVQMDTPPVIEVTVQEVALAGPAGKSAYQSALDNGFVGTEAEWIDSIGGGAVDSVNSQVGVVVLDAADVGAEPSGAVATHDAATTNVHGIADTSLLELAATSAFRQIQTLGTAQAFTTAALGAHEGDTTNIHGIADTAQLETLTGAQAKADAAQAAAATDATNKVAAASTTDRARANHTGTQAASTITGLATVATTGAYADLSGKPTIPSTPAGVGLGNVANLAQVDTSTAQNVSGIKTFLSNMILSAALTVAGTLNLKGGTGSVAWGSGNPNIRTGDGTGGSLGSFIVINSGTGPGDNTLYLNLDVPTNPVASSNMLINISGAPANRARFQVNPNYAGTIGSYDLSNWNGTGYKVPAAYFANVANGSGTTPAAAIPALVIGRDGYGGGSYNNIGEFKVFRTSHSVDASANTGVTLALMKGASGIKADADVMTWQADGKVGIGTTTPAANLDVVGTVNASGFVQLGPAAPNAATAASIWTTDFTSQQLATVIGGAGTVPAAGSIQALQLNATDSGGLNVNTIQGMNALAIKSVGGTAAALAAMNASARANSGVTITLLTGYVSQLRHPTGSTATTTIDFSATAATAGGTVTAAYGLKVAAKKATGVTTGYGVAVDGTADLNYFMYRVGIGNSAPTEALDVTGNIKVSGVIKNAAYATGSRPSASTSGAGAQVYDTTLSKPIWSDGTVWRDASGTAV